MRRCLVVLIALAVMFVAIGRASAQQPAQPAPPAGGHGMHHGGGMPQGMPGAGMPPAGGMPMMCQRMGGGGMMGGGMPMMGMMGGAAMDPKTMAQMLQLRGEMMKAMGDVLVKHGKAMEAARP